jgi:hypothetical protein
MDHIGVCAGGDLFHVRFADGELAAYDAGSWDRVGCRTRAVNDVACRHRSRIARIMILLTAKSVHFRFVIMHIQALWRGITVASRLLKSERRFNVAYL